ncbi:MAG: PAS domain-containing protein [Lachnospiraceae bacterium]|nr:PAS domain-containing protein [Lachnospiraceae bacterium]
MFGGKKSGKNQEAAMQIGKLQREIEELKESLEAGRAELDAVNRCAHLGIWKCFYDDAGNQISVEFSDEFRRLLGYTREEFPDSIENFGKLLNPEEAEMVFATYQATADDRSGKTRYDTEYRLLTKSGEYKWFHATGDVIRYNNGLPKEFIGTFSDIDKQKKSAEIFEHDSRRRKAVDLMMLEGSWSMDLTKYAIDDVNSPMVYSDQFKRILGYEPNSDEFPDVMGTWITKIHPDDVAIASEAMQRQLSDSTGRTVFDMEYRVRHKSGEYVWVQASSYVVWSEDKRPLMAAGTILDISKQKKNQVQFEEEMEPNIESLRAGIAEIAANVEKATAQMQEVSGKQEEVTKAANEIENAVNDSMEIIGSIQNITRQTNLLSLNASIEAARAGDAGRGFSVVASEVQLLSNSTKETTEHISERLTNMNDSVKGILAKINQISKSIADENEEMRTINATVEALHAAANEIAQMAESLYQ